VLRAPLLSLFLIWPSGYAVGLSVTVVVLWPSSLCAVCNVHSISQVSSKKLHSAIDCAGLIPLRRSVLVLGRFLIRFTRGTITNFCAPVQVTGYCGWVDFVCVDVMVLVLPRCTLDNTVASLCSLGDSSVTLLTSYVLSFTFLSFLSKLLENVITRNATCPLLWREDSQEGVLFLRFWMLWHWVPSLVDVGMSDRDVWTEGVFLADTGDSASYRCMAFPVHN
jgi:hypothetical protein